MEKHSHHYLEEVKETVRLYNILTQELEESFNDEQDELIYYRDNILHLFDNINELSDFDKLSDTSKRGVMAEIMLEKLSKRWLSINKIKGEVICNSLLNLNENKTSQLDVSIVTDKCIFIVECKSLYGELYITDDFGIKSKHLEEPLHPFRQNKTHIEALKNELYEKGIINIPYIYNIVFVFSRGRIMNFKQPLEENSRLLIPKGSLTVLSDLYENITSDVSETTYTTIVDLLKSKIPSIEEMVEHIENI